MRKIEFDCRNINVNEDEFMAALDEMEERELAELEAIAAEAEASEKEPHEFSEEFMAKQEALIREVEEREKMPFIYRFVNTPVKKAAIIAILVGVVALGFGGQSEAGKNPIVKFFQERYGELIGIEPHEDLWQNEEKPQTIETVYELGWVPEGYEKAEEEISEYVVMQMYRNKEDKRIGLEQYCVVTYYSFKEEKEYKEIVKDGVKFYFLNGEEENTVVWYQDGYQFVVRGSILQDEALKLIKSNQKRK